MSPAPLRRAGPFAFLATKAGSSAEEADSHDHELPARLAGERCGSGSWAFPEARPAEAGRMFPFYAAFTGGGRRHGKYSRALASRLAK